MSTATETWESRVSTAWAAQLWCYPQSSHLEMDVDFANHIALKMRPYLAPYASLEGHDRERLREVAARLKTLDGESWAAGAALEQICLTLDFHDDLLVHNDDHYQASKVSGACEEGCYQCISSPPLE